MKGCTVKGLCEKVGFCRQAYYKARKKRRHQSFDEEVVLRLVRSVRAQQPRLGGRKVYGELKSDLERAGVRIGRDRFCELLRRRAMLIKPKKKSIRTTYYDNALPVFRNLLYDRQPSAPHQVWVSDITYINTDEGHLYLYLITDLYSRKIVGFNAGVTLQSQEAIKALAGAIEQLPGNCWPIHHSDRGCQYCCHEYVRILIERGVSISMTEQNHCYENCYAERVNGILKDEYNLDLKFRNYHQARKAIEEAIILYNNHRPHGSLGMRKPTQVHRKAA